MNKRVLVVGAMALLLAVAFTGCTQEGVAPDDGTNGDSSGSDTDVTYNGEARSCWLYTGGAVGTYNSWKGGDLTTNEFQTQTSQGDGTASLVLSPGCGGDSPTYNGNPRECYSYNGNDQSTYNNWVSGSITTDEFQTQTSQGDGTAALSLHDGCR